MFYKSTNLNYLIKKYKLTKIITNKKIPNNIILKYLQKFLINNTNNIILPFNPKKNITTKFNITITNNNNFISSPIFTTQQLSSKYITLQLKTKIHNYTKKKNTYIIFSYSNQNTFTIIIINKHFYIQFKSNLYKTSIPIQISI